MLVVNEPARGFGRLSVEPDERFIIVRFARPHGVFAELHPLFRLTFALPVPVTYPTQRHEVPVLINFPAIHPLVGVDVVDIQLPREECIDNTTVGTLAVLRLADVLAEFHGPRRAVVSIDWIVYPARMAFASMSFRNPFAETVAVFTFAKMVVIVFSHIPIHIFFLTTPIAPDFDPVPSWVVPPALILRHPVP